MLERGFQLRPAAWMHSPGEILVHAVPKQLEIAPFTPSPLLFLSLLRPIRLPLGLRIFDLLFDRFAFPPSRHTPSLPQTGFGARGHPQKCEQ